MNAISMRKSHITEYEAIVLDLDGTLYYQKPFRIRMAAWLIGHLLRHPTSYKELMTIRMYRKVRENWEQYESTKQHPDSMSLDERQYQYVADRQMSTASRVESTVRFYMLEQPLKLLRPYRDEVLAGMIKDWKAQKKKIIIYSDYPVENKLKALDIEADACFCATDEEINCMKPDPKGLKFIQDKMGCSVQDMIMIGDRYEKDAMAAIANGMDYIILDTNRKKRKIQEKELL